MEPFGGSTFTALGTGVVVLSTDPAAIDVATNAVRAELAEIDRACSRFRPDSDLERVNRAKGRPVAVGPLLLDALDVALRAARLTEGDVDPTIGKALHVLGYDRDFEALDDSDDPIVRVAFVPGWQQVHVDREAGTARVPAGVRLDLGATAKALAADRAAARANAAAECGVLVSLGGDLATAGEPVTEGWRVRVTDWHGAAPDGIGDLDGETVVIHDGALATSSTTVRRWRRGGDSLHHIVDPKTGLPAAGRWRTVSVAASTCVDANIATTGAIIRGDAAPEWLANFGLPARLVRTNGTVVHVCGWGGHVGAAA